MELYKGSRDFNFSKLGLGAGLMLAHAYVPPQEYGKVYSPHEAMCKGTIFPELWGVYRIPR